MKDEIVEIEIWQTDEETGEKSGYKKAKIKKSDLKEILDEKQYAEIMGDD